MKKIIIVICAVLVVGLGIFTVGTISAASNDENFLKDYEKTQKVITDVSGKDLSIECHVERVNIEKIDGNDLVLTYFEGEKLVHTLTETNDEIKLETKRKFNFLGITWVNFSEQAVITVGIPSSFNGEIEVESETGGIKAINLGKQKSLDFDVTTGSVEVDGVDADDGEFVSTTGSVKVSNCYFKSDVYLKTTTGSVTAENITTDGKVEIKVTTGSIRAEAECLAAKFTSTTGGIRFELKGCNDIYLSCTTGSIQGDVDGVRNDFDVECSTSTGKCNLTDKVVGKGKKLYAKTTTGSITIKFEK